MQYAQLNEALDQATQLDANANIEWDDRNYCTAAALVRDGKAEQFRVVLLTATDPTPINPATHIVTRDGCEKVGNEWRYKWVVTAKSPEEIANNLLQAKAAKRLEINLWRATANQTYFTHQGKQVACDQLSRSDIDGVGNNISLTGNFPAGFPNAWKAMDNTYIMLPTIASFKDMYGSMTQQGTVNFARSQTLKAAVDAATTVEQLAVITWNEED